MKRFVCFLLAVATLLFCVAFVGCKKEGDGYTKYEITAEYSPQNKAVSGAVKVTFENGQDKEISLLKCFSYALNCWSSLAGN